MKNQIIQGYVDEAATLIARYEAISSAQEYSTLLHLLPDKRCRVLDIGAGTGRDAAWFAASGHDVLAVEPVAEFREAGAMRHGSRSIEWMDDVLPTLSHVFNRGEEFDLLVVNGVWQHLKDEQRRTSTRNLRLLSARDGLMIISLRHGPGAPTRPCFEVSSQDTIEFAASEGFQLIYIEERESIQPQNRAAGVTWTWLVFSLPSIRALDTDKDREALNRKFHGAPS